MAIYSVQVKSLSRGKGDSATAAAAYRAGLCVEDPSGARHDYSKKAGVLSVDMLAPDGAPAWATDPHQLWAKVEEHETRKNARVAREVLAALPHELTPEQRRGLAKDLGQLLVDRYSVAAQVALHAPDKGGDNRNYHTHILITPRQVGPDGFGNSAAKVLDEFKAGAQELKDLRAAIGARINAALAAAGVSERVDHRRLEDQKADALKRGDFSAVAQLDRTPTKHEGKAVTQARRRGERLPRAKRNDKLKTAGERRFNQHTHRFEGLKAKAAAEGLLQPVDEQALHARALLERCKESARSLQASAGAEVLAIDQSLVRKAAVQARARRPAAHKARSYVTRPAAGTAGHQGRGAAAIERASRKHTQSRQGETMAVEQAAKNLDEMIEQMFQVARRALQSSETTPLQRSAARALIQRHTDLEQRHTAHAQAKTGRHQARLNRRMAVGEANMTPVPTDFRSRTLRMMGLPTAEDRAAQAAQEQKRQAKMLELQTRKVRNATREAKNHAVVAFERSMADFLVQFPEQFPPGKPTAELGPTRDMAPVPQPPEQTLRQLESVSSPRRPSSRP